MTLMLRFVSFGGWLAHHFNQEWGDDYSKSVRPAYLGVFVGLASLTSGLIASSLLYHAAWRDMEGWIAVLIFGCFALLLTVGWLANTVPLVVAEEDGSRTVRARRLSPGQVADTHATGVVGLGSDRRRFRHRPAVLERSSDGELHLTVKRWTAQAARALPA
jgi:hypothetical protein